MLSSLRGTDICLYLTKKSERNCCSNPPSISTQRACQSQPTNMASTGILAVTPVSLVSPFVSPYVPCSSSAIIVSCFLHMLLWCFSFLCVHSNCSLEGNAFLLLLCLSTFDDPLESSSSQPSPPSHSRVPFACCFLAHCAHSLTTSSRGGGECICIQV